MKTDSETAICLFFLFGGLTVSKRLRPNLFFLLLHGRRLITKGNRKRPPLIEKEIKGLFLTLSQRLMLDLRFAKMKNTKVDCLLANHTLRSNQEFFKFITFPLDNRNWDITARHEIYEEVYNAWRYPNLPLL